MAFITHEAAQEKLYGDNLILRLEKMPEKYPRAERTDTEKDLRDVYGDGFEGRE